MNSEWLHDNIKIIERYREEHKEFPWAEVQQLVR